MPWFPDFVTAAELARRQTRDPGQAVPAGRYLTSLSEGDTRPLEGARGLVEKAGSASVRARRAVSSPMPELPPITTTVARPALVLTGRKQEWSRWSWFPPLDVHRDRLAV